MVQAIGTALEAGLNVMLNSLRDALSHVVTVTKRDKDRKRQSEYRARSKELARARVVSTPKQDSGIDEGRTLTATCSEKSNSIAKVQQQQQPTPTKLDDIERKTQEAVSQIFPVDARGTRQIVAAARAIRPDLTWDEMADALKKSRRSDQRSAMLFVSTIPQALKIPVQSNFWPVAVEPAITKKKSRIEEQMDRLMAEANEQVARQRSA